MFCENLTKVPTHVKDGNTVVTVPMCIVVAHYSIGCITEVAAISRDITINVLHLPWSIRMATIRRWLL